MTGARTFLGPTPLERARNNSKNWTEVDSSTLYEGDFRGSFVDLDGAIYTRFLGDPRHNQETPLFWTVNDDGEVSFFERRSA